MSTPSPGPMRTASVAWIAEHPPAAQTTFSGAQSIAFRARTFSARRSRSDARPAVAV